MLLLLVSIFLGGGVALTGEHRPTQRAVLPPARAIGVKLDTLLIGGFASGTFEEAVHALSSELSEEERELVGEHLARIFAEVVPPDGIGRAGRLRVAYERAVRPGGGGRSIRVLGAEVAVRGRLHTAYYFERQGRPAYFDPFGRSLDGEAWPGPLASMRVTSSFGGRRLHPILNRVLPHSGVDLAAPTGAPVRATADGLVTAAGERGGYGLFVELQHPSGYSTRYAHLSRIAPGLERARVVRKGEIIGLVGETGLATGPHLHYEVRRRGQPVDPLKLIGAPDAASDAGTDPEWPAERRKLATLLARTPTLLAAD